MTRRNLIKPYEWQPERKETPEPVRLGESETAFLLNVVNHPYHGTVERYRSLGLSRRKGNAIRQGLIDKGLLKIVDIPTQSGKIVLAELSEKARKHLGSLGHKIPERSRWGGLEHEYWKHKAAERLQNEGWQVTLEDHEEGYTDLIAAKGEERIAVEIETGKSNWQNNIQKNRQRGFQNILILATNAEAHQKIIQVIKEQPPGVNLYVKPAQEFVEKR
jgi:hypothetical protein